MSAGLNCGTLCTDIQPHDHLWHRTDRCVAASVRIRKIALLANHLAAVVQMLPSVVPSLSRQAGD